MLTNKEKELFLTKIRYAVFEAIDECEKSNPNGSISTVDICEAMNRVMNEIEDIFERVNHSRIQKMN